LIIFSIKENNISTFNLQHLLMTNIMGVKRAEE